MRKYILNFENCKHWLEFHQVWKETFEFPDYYGKNWSALWDCLRYLFTEPTLLELHGVAYLGAKFGENVPKTLIEILDDLHEEHSFVTYQIIS